MSTSSEVLSRGREFILRDMDQRLQPIMTSLKTPGTIGAQYTECTSDQVKGVFRGQVTTDVLPRMMNRYGESLPVLHHYLIEDDVTVWFAHPMTNECFDKWHGFQPSIRRFGITDGLVREMWKRFDAPSSLPYGDVPGFEFSRISDRTADFRYLNERGFGVVLGLYRKFDDTMSYQRQVESSFILQVRLPGSETSRDLLDIEDVLAAVREIDDLLAAGVHSHTENPVPLGKDDSHFVQWLGEQAFLIKTEFGKDAGDRAFIIHSNVKKHLGLRGPV
jgi:hypothetical protein